MSPIRCAALMLGLAAALPAQAADWGETCTDSSCQLAVAARDSASGTFAASLVLDVPRAAADPVSLIVRAPLGVSLAPGVRVVVGAAHLDLPALTCLPAGCDLGRVVNAEELALLTAAETVEVRFFAYDSGQQFAVPLQTGGLAAALEGVARQ